MHTFKTVSPADPAASELLDEYFAERAEGFPGGGYLVNRPDPARFLPPRGAFILLVEGQRVLGCGGVRDLGAGSFEIKHVYLRPETRGRGLGRELLGRLEHEARALGATGLVLDTNASLAAAGGLYRASGYAEIKPYNDNPNATHWFGKTLG
ncbi:GNAT family N-acetyltransferase [Mycetocola spongiae]|uniref:GNAT family N-acetyltransferase n=1 Tax=Mycetocola spongiae TaxID=2859226 RepID=UPI001CF50698|nr:GNAT family N-acetyltransferase [Mycetocola spongiae]